METEEPVETMEMDDSNLALWSGVAFASGLLLLVMALFGLKKRRKEEES